MFGCDSNGEAVATNADMRYQRRGHLLSCSEGGEYGDADGRSASASYRKRTAYAVWNAKLTSVDLRTLNIPRLLSTCFFIK